MAMNTAPVFTLTPKINWTIITAADTGLDGTGANVKSLFTAGSNGSYIQNIVIKSNTSNATSATTLRIYINNGSSVGTASNNTLIKEFSLSAATASNTNATLNWEFPLNLQLPASYVILVAAAVVGGSTGFAVTGIGSDY